MLASFIAALATQALFASAQNIRRDPGVYGPALEVAHLYYGQWPTGFVFLHDTKNKRHADLLKSHCVFLG